MRTRSPTVRSKATTPTATHGHEHDRRPAHAIVDQRPSVQARERIGARSAAAVHAVDERVLRQARIESGEGGAHLRHDPPLARRVPGAVAGAALLRGPGDLRPGMARRPLVPVAEQHRDALEGAAGAAALRDPCPRTGPTASPSRGRAGRWCRCRRRPPRRRARARPASARRRRRPCTARRRRW